MAELRFDPDGGLVLNLEGGVDDAGLERVLRGDRSIVAIDAPLGWPVDFVKAVNGWGRAEGREWTGDEVGDPTSSPGFEHLKLRRTDVAAGRHGGDDRGSTWPLPYSVAADKIAVTTFRTLGVLQRAYPEVDITGRTGRVLEVWPGASLAAFGIDAKGYKGTKRDQIKKRRTVAEAVFGQLKAGLARNAELAHHAEGIDPKGDMLDEVASTDHKLDALVAAITAWAVLAGLETESHEVPEDILALEGWIHVPFCGNEAARTPGRLIEEVMSRSPLDGIRARTGQPS